jgi:hypothetical protein
VKAFKPETLQDAIIRTRDMEDVVPKKKTFSKPFIPQKNKDKKPFQKEWTGKEKLDEATRNELRRKKLCFSCKEPWDLGHRCMGKGKVHYIEVHSDSDEEEEEVTQEQGNEQGGSSDEQPREEAKGVTIATLSGTPRYYTFRVRGVLWGQCVTTLIDGGVTHNFIDATLVARRCMATEDFEGFNVVVADGFNMTCTQKI